MRSDVPCSAGASLPLAAPPPVWSLFWLTNASAADANVADARYVQVVSPPAPVVELVATAPQAVAPTAALQLASAAPDGPSHDSEDTWAVKKLLSEHRETEYRLGMSTRPSALRSPCGRSTNECAQAHWRWAQSAPIQLR